jgi:hypothetical protein
MHCHFIKDGHLQQVMELPYLPESEAVDRARKMFEAVPELFDCLEVWGETGLIYREDRRSLPGCD